jgi:hypothetical protein
MPSAEAQLSPEHGPQFSRQVSKLSMNKRRITLNLDDDLVAAGPIAHQTITREGRLL